MGFVYNGEYLAYFEVGRAELMRSVGLPYSEFEKSGYFLPLTEAHLDFKNPAYYDDLLSVKATLKFDFYKATIKIIYNIFRINTTIAEGYTVHTFLKSDSGKPVKPPKIFVDAILAEFKKGNPGS
jgi:acyl-CoA thioester hydrolase